MKKLFIHSLKPVVLVCLLIAMFPALGQEYGGTFDARTEERLGRSAYSSDNWLFTKSTTWTPMAGSFAAAYRGVAANFLAEANGTRVAVYFTAETKGADMEVRAIVDGVAMDPGVITFSSGNHAESRAFVFTGVFSKGIHSVRMEWRTLSRFWTAYVRDAAILIRKDDPDNAGNMRITSTPSQAITTQNAWTNIPDMSLNITTQADEVLVASIAMEIKVDQGKSLFVRGLVDGMPSVPENVLFARGPQTQARTMTFGFSGLQAGQHTVTFQWSVQNGGPAISIARSMVLSAMPSEATTCEPHMKYKTVSSGPNVHTTSQFWQPIPDMDMDVSVPENGEIAVIFSTETAVQNNKNLNVRMRVGNQVIAGSAVTLAKGNTFSGVHAYIFVAKHINARSNASLKHIQLEWRVPISGGAMAEMGDRSMCVMVEQGGTPDLAEAPRIGVADHPLGGPSTIEPLQGNVPLLAIMIDPGRPGHPAPSVSALDDQLFGAHSTQDYYARVSGGRFTLSKVAIYSFQADAADPEHYWTHHTCDCDNDEDCDPNTSIDNGYIGGHAERWAEAITKTDAAGFNFATYDRNRDGLLDPRELAILIITPQKTGDGTMRLFNPYCPTQANPEGKFVVDGVRIFAIAEWYTAANTPTAFSTPTHELGHLLLNLGDIYIEDANVATEAGSFDMMAHNNNRTAHFQGRTKLALGWATPRFIRQTGTYAIEDVRTSEEVLILPRINGVDGKEFFLLENRQHKFSDPNYDEAIYGKGIAIWHIVESSTHYNFTPLAVACEGNWALTDFGKARRTARLLRPTVRHLGFEDCSLWQIPNLFGACPIYDISSNGFNCPGGANPARNALKWADNYGSGYQLKNWPMASSVMDVDIVVPYPLGPNCPDDRDELDITAGADKIAYLGMPGQQWVQLTATANGCQGPYSYRWNTGATTASIWVNPTATTTYTVTVIAQGSNCTASDDVTVEVIDVRCGPFNHRVEVCYQGNNLCVFPFFARYLLSQGAVLGNCPGGNRTVELGENDLLNKSICQVFPNPFSTYTNFAFTLDHDTQATLRIYNMKGQLIEEVYKGRVMTGMQQSAQWHAEGHPQGLYLYRLSSERGLLAQGKVNLVK